MQLQPQQTMTQSADSLDAKLEAARSQLSKLKAAAEDANANAQRADIAFTREPTEQAAVAQIVTRQKAANAAAAAHAYERDAVQPLERDAAKAERERIAVPLNAEAKAIRADFARCGALLIESMQLLDATISRIAAQNQPRFDAKQHGCLLSELSLRELVAALAARVQSELGGLQHEQSGRHVSVSFADEGNSGFVAIRINRPATVPSHVR